MFLLDRYMNKLKGFIQQRVKPKGYMVEGYISYESFYYLSENIKQINDTLTLEICDDERDEDKREGDLIEMNGKRCMIKFKCRLVICQITTQ